MSTSSSVEPADSEDQDDGVDRAVAPRGSWAWWWTYATGTLVLLAVIVGAVVLGQQLWLSLPALAVSVVGFAAFVLGFRQSRRSPTPGPPREVNRAWGRAESSERRTMMREARRGRTVTGPLATASRWHRNHRFVVDGPLRVPYGLGLMLGTAGSTTGQLVGSAAERTGLTVIGSIFAAITIAFVLAGLQHYWVLLTHAASISGSWKGPRPRGQGQADS